MRLLMYLSILFFLFSTSCNNDDNTVPPITQENTFSCKINGKLFVPKDHGGFPIKQDGIVVDFQENNTWDFLFGNGEIDIYIHLANITATGNRGLGESDGDGDFFQEADDLMEVDLDLANSRFGTTHVSTSASGTLRILELETGKRIVLEFDEIILEGVSESYSTIKLTDGKLNINLDTFWNE